MSDETTPVAPAAGGVLGFLKGLPVVGALLKGVDGGATSTEFGLLAGVVGLVTAYAASMTWPLATALAGAAVGVGLYALARSNAKAMALLLVGGLALGASGCANTIHRVLDGAETGVSWLSKGAEAGGSILNILKGPLEDSAAVLDATFGKPDGDGAGAATPAPDAPEAP